MFHALALTCADLLIGTVKAKRSKHAWRQVYRGLEHGSAKHACKNKEIIAKFPPGIVDFAQNFHSIQEKRHSADYDPHFVLTNSEVESDINIAEASIRSLCSEPPKDLRAFATYVLLKTRGG